MTNQVADPYATLGIPRTASRSEVRAAYRRLAKQYHPDLHRDVQSTEQMQRINQAWEILSSPTNRARFEATMRASTAQPHWARPQRRAQSPGASSETWVPPRQAWAPPPQAYATYGARVDDRADDRGFGPLGWVGLLFLVPLVIVFAAAVSGGLLFFPLIGLLVLVVAGRLAGRDD
jgi:hypothetical protein